MRFKAIDLSGGQMRVVIPVVLIIALNAVSVLAMDSGYLVFKMSRLSYGEGSKCFISQS
jgi:hypothetical protein